MTTPSGPVRIPRVGGPIEGPGEPNVLIGSLPAAGLEELPLPVESDGVVSDASG